MSDLIYMTQHGFRTLPDFLHLKDPVTGESAIYTRAPKNLIAVCNKCGRVTVYSEGCFKPTECRWCGGDL